VKTTSSENQIHALPNRHFNTAAFTMGTGVLVALTTMFNDAQFNGQLNATTPVFYSYIALTGFGSLGAGVLIGVAVRYAFLGVAHEIQAARQNITGVGEDELRLQSAIRTRLSKAGARPS